MKLTIIIGILLLLLCSYTALPVTQANIVTKDGAVASYKPYITYPSNLSYISTVSYLNVSFRAQVWRNVKYTMVYSLDGQENKPLLLEEHYFSWVQGEHDKSYVEGSVLLPQLTNGSHNIKVTLTCNWQIGYSTGWEDNYYYDSEQMYFTVNNSILQEPTPVVTSTPTSIPIAPETNADSTLPLNTFIVIIAVITAAITSVSILALRRHRKTTVPDQ